MQQRVWTEGRGALWREREQVERGGLSLGCNDGKKEEGIKMDKMVKKEEEKMDVIVMSLASHMLTLPVIPLSLTK